MSQLSRPFSITHRARLLRDPEYAALYLKECSVDGDAEQYLEAFEQCLAVVSENLYAQEWGMFAGLDFDLDDIRERMGSEEQPKEFRIMLGKVVSENRISTFQYALNGDRLTIAKLP